MQYFDPLSLRLFITICEEQSLTDAADRENLTVSAVSKRLTGLENQVGTALLERGRGGGMHLTPAGEALLPAARGLLQSMARIQASVSEYALNVPSTVRVAATSSALTAALPHDVAAFRTRRPHLKVNLEERTGPEIVAHIEEGRADIGVCWDAVGMKRLQTTPYVVNNMVVIVHPSHELAHCTSISFADTLDYDRVMIDVGSSGLQLQQRLAIANGKALKTPVHVRNYETGCHIVAANLGIALVPREATRTLVKSLHLKVIKLVDDWARRRLVLCVRDRQELPTAARQLHDVLAGTES